MNLVNLDALLHTFLAEDIGTGDVTTLSCIPADKQARGVFRAKADGVICGLSVAMRVFGLVDDAIQLTSRVSDGERVGAGQIIAEIQGSAQGILSGERVALNLLQHLSGISTNTAYFAAQIAGTKAKICDTRKTTPGLRVLEKYAVKTGGGANHRFGLADGILIKDNHIIAAGGIKQAVDAARDNAPHTLKIQVETENLEMVNQALDAGADIIMLDNMDVETMSQAVKLIGGRAIVEASGNMDRQNLREVAGCGVDYISMGALTHSVTALDISLKLTLEDQLED